ncbi:MAG: PLP-dependent aspartate aminotransferase family protein [Parcubacteria group bacterium]
MAKNYKDCGVNTKSIHGDRDKHTEIGEHVFPLFQTSTFLFKDVKQGADRFAGKGKGYKYSRLGNPTVDLLAERIALLEEGEVGKIYPTGMAAIGTVLEGLLGAGDHLVIDPVVYGCTDSLVRTILSRFDIEASFVDTSDIEEVRKSLKKNTKVVFLETPANPTLKIVDIKKVAEEAKKYNPEIKVVVDNTFATPIYQQPLKLGADVVVHSCTKYLNGHGDVVAGAAVFGGELEKQLNHIQVDLGTSTSPFDAWLMLRGLKTLPLRMERHTVNAKKVVEFLENHDKIDQINYPGFSGMISFELKDGAAAGEKLLNGVELCGLAVSLGNVDTLICHPASMTHAIIPKEQREKAGITDGLVRLSVGIENVEDIIGDLEQGLEKV